MNTRVLVSVVLGLALAGGCKKKEAAYDRPATEPAGSAQTMTGSGSGSAAAPTPDPKRVERGAYLASILGCPYCHMPMGPKGPDTSRPFAGGMEIPEKFGTWRAPNITPHKGSGIGTWTDDQIAAAIREGVRPDGGKLYPIMPYLNYNRMTDDDVQALVAYLRTVPAVDNVVAPNKDLKMPQIPAPKPANAPDVAADPMKHGEYLVTMMHCVVCHTPVSPEGMPDFSKAFAGGMEFNIPMLGSGTLYGQNITSDADTGIGKWSQDDVAKAIKMMTRPDGTVIQGPMQFYLAGWSKMEDKDVVAIATFVKAIPPIKNKVTKATFKPGAPMGPPPGADGAAAGSGEKK